MAEGDITWDHADLCGKHNIEKSANKNKGFIPMKKIFAMVRILVRKGFSDLNVSRLQEVGLPLRGEDGNQEGGRSSHFTSKCKGKRYNHQSLPHEWSPSWVPAVEPPTPWIAGVIFGEEGQAPVEVSPVVNNQTKKAF